MAKKIENQNIDLWNRRQETDPNHTKEVDQKGGFTSVAAQFQIKNATEEWGQYGQKWGIKELNHEFIRLDNPPKDIIALVSGIFYYPDGEFPMTSSIFICYKNRGDDDFAKKALTDMTTKGLSKLGFNADVFMGLYDDNKYVNDLRDKYEAEEAAKPKPPARIKKVKTTQKTYDNMVKAIKSGDPERLKKVRNYLPTMSDKSMMAKLVDMITPPQEKEEPQKQEEAPKQKEQQYIPPPDNAPEENEDDLPF